LPFPESAWKSKAQCNTRHSQDDIAQADSIAALNAARDIALFAGGDKQAQVLQTKIAHLANVPFTNSKPIICRFATLRKL
jgi:hypothetical protein